MIQADQITGIVLAGGRGSRMGGVDKGLQPFNGAPLVHNALQRLQRQQGGLIGALMVNANRNLTDYEAMGVPVWPDTLPDFAGPLAGFLTGLTHCETPWLLTVPCDTPLFPLDLAVRLAQALVSENAEIAMAAATEEDGALRAQPVFCLMPLGLRDSLTAFTSSGGRKAHRWTEQHRTAIVPFNRSDDDPMAFFNANTLDELRALEQRGALGAPAP